jgi:hypothetical protein
MGKHTAPAPRPLSRRGGLQTLGATVVAAGCAVALAASPASASSNTVGFPTGNGYLRVPAGPVTVSFSLVAGGGGASGDGSHSGGFGGLVSGTFTWTGPATIMRVTVGQGGFAGGPAGTSSRNGGRGGGNGTLPNNGYLRGHGGNGGTGGPVSTTVHGNFEPGGGGGGGATTLVVNNVIVLVAGGGGGGSGLENGVNGNGAGTSPRWCAPGGVGKTGQVQQVGGGGGGGGAINGVGGGSGLGGGGGTGFAGGIAHLSITVTATGQFGDGTYGLPGVDGSAVFTGDGIEAAGGPVG